MDGGRHHGSTILATVTGLALILFATVFLFSNVKPTDYRWQINVGSFLYFGIILLWWSFSSGKKWGIGNETVVMTVTVVVAAIAVITLTSIGS